ncbi:MAG TPA: sigma-70 region 4 domain-containing protein [Solirubrobacteraceae bacterium]|jgi:hypothetical protein|nr:sigma-70 region 4 domain-containing protein [Solirubrobacteraceae bacterium]
MSRLDELPPDQRAALSLVLLQKKSYAEVAALLRIGEQAVHDRAHAALAVLAPAKARALSADERALVGDYMLGQQAIAERLRARSFIAATPAARTWASALAAELAPIAAGDLPDVPEAGGAASLEPRGAAPAAGSSPAPARPPAAPAAVPAARSPAATLPSSRTGGAILLALIIAAVVVAVVFITKGGTAHPHRRQSSTAAKTSTGPAITARIALRSPNPASRTVGLVSILAEGSRRAFYLAAENVPSTRGFFYALWLYESPSKAEALGRAPSVGANHKLEGGGSLPADAGQFKELLLTRETSSAPSHPGTVVLRGTLTLGSG